MAWSGDSDDEVAGGDAADLTQEQLLGLQYGVAATIMPVAKGWRIRYFSTHNFEGEPGTTFPNFDAALQAMAEVLPLINSAEERVRSHDELLRRICGLPEELT
ncbi:MAG: hypothetical protein ACRDFX_01365 [Chloroflexota bacterium]